MEQEKTLLFITLKRNTLPGDKQDCSLCGKENLEEYWKVGEINVNRRSKHLCNYCKKVVVS